MLRRQFLWHRTTQHHPMRNCSHALADFYYELGVQVIEACITSRPFTGGLLELSLVHKYVQVRSLLWVPAASLMRTC